MTEERRDHLRDVDFIRENRSDFFGSPNHFLGILRGNVKVPHTASLGDNQLTDKEVQMLSFGQFLYYMAQQKRLKMASFAEQLEINQDYLVDIYEDSVFPWDLDPVLIKRMGSVLGVSVLLMKSIIRNHPLDEWLLKQRLPQGFSAARTSHKLSRFDRATGLDETDLLLQRDRESDRMKQFLEQL